MSSALTAIGWEHEAELETAEGLSLDMAQPATMQAIEFDGPSHFFRDSCGEYHTNGATSFKHRLLTQLGWHVVRVPYYDWRLLADASAKEGYVVWRIVAALNWNLVTDWLRTQGTADGKA